jgi:hypothetical protein
MHHGCPGKQLLAWVLVLFVTTQQHAAQRWQLANSLMLYVSKADMWITNGCNRAAASARQRTG